MKIDPNSVTLRLFEISRDRVDRFQLKMLQVLHNVLPLKACSLYSVSEGNDFLSLRGQVGLDYSDYESFSLPLEATAGRVLADTPILYIEDVKEIEDYRDGALIEKFDLSRMMVVPIRNEESLHEHKVVCVICLYPELSAQIEDLIELVEMLKISIELATRFSLDFTFQMLRQEIVEHAIHTSDAASFLHKTLALLRTNWNIEAGSVFLHDRRAKLLRLAASTGIKSTGLTKRHIFYKLAETNRRTVTSFLDQRPLIIQVSDQNNGGAKYKEELDTTFHSALIQPFFGPELGGGEKEDRCLGVFRLVNRQIVHDNQTETAHFTWEDSAIADFLGSILGVVTQLYLRVGRKIDDFERIVHGLENSILTMSGTLHNLHDNNDLKTILPLPFHYSVPNSIAFSESIHEQIRVFKMRDLESYDTVELSKCNLYGDILTKLPSYANMLAQVYAVERISLIRTNFLHSQNSLNPTYSFAEQPFMKIPAILTDKALLLSVFKNLAENAVKYCQDNNECKIQMRWESDSKYVTVFFEDWGIGVPEEDAEFIFYETYQAENAMRRRTQGTGIGLFQCQLIMEKLGGKIWYERPTDTGNGIASIFCIQIPRFGSY